MRRETSTLDIAKATALLNVTASASDADLRAAYLEQVRQHPPDRDADLFEQIRDAYDLLRDPGARALRILDGPDPAAPLASLLNDKKPARCFVGSQLWIDLLKEKRS
jgi:curved DNA-binding protein CbpA